MERDTNSTDSYENVKYLSSFYMCGCSAVSFQPPFENEIDRASYVYTTDRKCRQDKPTQSNFNVFAYLTGTGVKCGQKGRRSRFYVQGHNIEPGVLSQALCAERAAMSTPDFRHLSDQLIEEVGIITDSTECIAPGPLCREFMSSFSDGSTIITLTNIDKTKIHTAFLKDIYPFPYIYRRILRDDIESVALLWKQRFLETAPMSELLTNKVYSDYNLHNIYTLAMKAANEQDSDSMLNRAALHPVKFGASVAFSDGHIETSGSLKGRLVVACNVVSNVPCIF
jgi:cytidine deaminase